MSEVQLSSVTTDQLRFAAPSGIQLWGIERHQKGLWVRQQWHDHRGTRPKATMHFPVTDLSVGAIRDRWGPGRYRLVYSRGPGKKPQGWSEPFDIGEREPHESIEDDDAPELVEEAANAAPPDMRAHGASNGNGHAHVPRAHPMRGIPTAIGRPPLFATDAAQYIRVRDGSPMETFMAMFTLLEKMQQDARDHENRRSQEFMRMMDLKEKTIVMDAQVRIAEASARSAADREHAATLRAELDKLRELGAAAQVAAAKGNASELGELLGQLQEQLEGLQDGGDDGDEEAPGAGMQLIATLANQLVPPLAKAIAQRIALGAAEAEPQIGDAIDAALEGE